MRKIVLFLVLSVLSLSASAQDKYEKKYSLGRYSGGKWYKLMTLDLNGNGNYNSINVAVNLHYVNTGTKYDADAVLRLREGPDTASGDWQFSNVGFDRPAFSFKKVSTKVFELWGYSSGGWAHMSFEAYVTREAPLIITIPENPIEASSIDNLEDVPQKGDWCFSDGAIQIDQKNDSNGDRAFIITEPGNNQRITMHLANNNSGKYGYLSLGGQTSLRGNGQPSYLEGFVGIGTKTSEGYKLAVNGKIRAKEIKVETNWADYVFANDYNLPTLEEVEKHIQEKGHLINIPSAKEVEENGIHLGQISSKLLEKIEELTLYTISQEKEIELQKEKLKQQEVTNKALLNENKALEERLNKLEELVTKMKK